MDITCYRNPELARETRALPAKIYNLAYQLITDSATRYVFVPLRTMQYLAILNADEFVFIDGDKKCWVDIAWTHFQPQNRASLSDPVSYESIYYQPLDNQFMSRLLTEFPLALTQFALKNAQHKTADILHFPTAKK